MHCFLSSIFKSVHYKVHHSSLDVHDVLYNKLFVTFDVTYVSLENFAFPCNIMLENLKVIVYFHFDRINFTRVHYKIGFEIYIVFLATSEKSYLFHDFHIPS